MVRLVICSPEIMKVYCRYIFCFCLFNEAAICLIRKKPFCRTYAFSIFVVIVLHLKKQEH